MALIENKEYNDLLLDISPCTGDCSSLSRSKVDFPIPSVNPFQQASLGEMENQIVYPKELKELCEIPERKKGKKLIVNSPDAQLINSKEKRTLIRSPLLVLFGGRPIGKCEKISFHGLAKMA